MTAKELKELIESTGVTVFHDRTRKNADGTPLRWRINGQIKLFKRDPYRMRMPLKHGMGYSRNDYTIVESVQDFNLFLVIPE